MVLRRVRENKLPRGTRKLWGVINKFYIKYGIVSWVYSYVKIPNLHFKPTQFFCMLMVVQ